MAAEINLNLGDCMEAMKGMKDNEFDLAIVDPPYGIGADSMKYANDGGTKTGAARRTKFHVSNWDRSIPDRMYFDEIKRVSDNQIIWGWNYYVAYLNSCPSYIVWNKKTNGSFADCEQAWCSKAGAARVFEYLWNGMLQGDMKNKEVRIHPTQKPVKLYEWLLMNYAKEGDRIFDSHMGSGSIAIACHNLGLNGIRD